MPDIAICAIALAVILTGVLIFACIIIAIEHRDGVREKRKIQEDSAASAEKRSDIR